MGIFSSDKKTTQNTTNTSNVTDNSLNANLDGVEGDAIISRGDVNIQSTDYGAISSALSTVDKGLDRTLDFADNIGGKAIGGVVEANDRALDFGSNALSDSLMFGQNALNTGASLATKSIDAVAKSAGDTASTLSNAIDKAAAASRTDSTESFNKLVKYGSIALGVIAVAIAAAYALKGK